MVPSVVFLVQNAAISPDAAGGAAALYFNHLELLANSQSDLAIHLVILSSPEIDDRFRSFRREQPETWARVCGWCESWQEVVFRTKTRRSAPLRNFAYGVARPSYLFKGYDGATADRLAALFSVCSPTIAWAEHLGPASAVLDLKIPVPLVYSHHDWAWRIKRLRSGARGDSPRYRVRNWLMRRYEEQLVTRFSGTLSASATEAADIEALGAPNCAYVPPIYAPVENREIGEPSDPRVVHLGGMNTTANRIGLHRFLSVSWPIVCAELQRAPELWIVGSLDGAASDLMAEIEKSGAVCTGFVANLREVLRPNDIHIVPWEHNTGSRTRIPLILNYGQALVSTRPGAACFPELHGDDNCVLVDDLLSMADAVVSLVRDDNRRMQIAKTGRATFLECFTREAVQPRFDQFLESVVSGSRRGDSGGVAGRAVRAEA